LGVKPFDTLLVGAGLDVAPPSQKLLGFLRETVKDAKRVASMCVGTFILAEAGVLDGRRVTTHWAWAKELAERFPKARVEMDRIFIADGPVWTCAGMTACIDMALGIVERDVGADIARATAKMLVVHHRRAGGQSQHSAMFELDAKTDRVQDALAFARKNLREPLTVEQLAQAACISPRQFARLFRMETVNHLLAPSRIFASRPPETCLSKASYRSRMLRVRSALVLGNECAAVSCAPMVKPLRPYASPPSGLQRYRHDMHRALPASRGNARRNRAYSAGNGLSRRLRTGPSDHFGTPAHLSETI
jgi:AraC-like DNA-binding protein